jgi:hypothetical protein
MYVIMKENIFHDRSIDAIFTFSKLNNSKVTHDLYFLMFDLNLVRNIA